MPAAADYFPRMRPTEVLLFRQYDSREEAMSRRMVFHQAVEDPTSPPDAPLRSTIEVRVLAIYEDRETDRDGRVARFQAECDNTYCDGTPSTWFSGVIEERLAEQSKSKL